MRICFHLNQHPFQFLIREHLISNHLLNNQLIHSKALKIYLNQHTLQFLLRNHSVPKHKQIIHSKITRYQKIHLRRIVIP